MCYNHINFFNIFSFGVNTIYFMQYFCIGLKNVSNSKISFKNVGNNCSVMLDDKNQVLMNFYTNNLQEIHFAPHV